MRDGSGPSTHREPRHSSGPLCRPRRPGRIRQGSGIPSADVAKHQLSALATGERVISERLPGVRSVAIGFWVGTGSRDEPDARAGISHFIEHLLFKGSSRYSAQDIAEIFDELGGELNAATSRETTVIYARVPDDRLETALDVMSDMVFRPTFADVDSEREVVLEEIAMVDDTPHDLVHDIAAEAVFGGHPLGRPVIGRADVISNVSRRALAAYHRRAYVGEQLVLAAAGNVGTEARGASRRATQRRHAGPRPPPAPARLPRPGLRFRARTRSSTTSVSAAPEYRARTSDASRPLLDAIVGGSASSRLFQEIREKRGMAYSVYSYSSQHEEIGRSASTWARARRTCRSASRSQSRSSPTSRAATFAPDELARAKENLKGRLLLSLESTSNRMSRLGKATISDTPLLSIDEIVERLDAVSAYEVAALPWRCSRPSASRWRDRPGRGPLPEAVARVNPTLAEKAA